MIGLFFNPISFTNKKTTMKALTLISLLSILISCASSKETNSKTILKIQYGNSYGNCIGYCWNQYTLDGKTINENRKATGRGDRSKYPEINESKDLKNSDWENVVKTVNQQKLMELAETIGCPDCADGGAEWISVEFSDGTSKKVTIEAGSKHEDLIELIRLIKNVSNDYFPKKI